MCNALQVEEIVQFYDANHDGSIDRQEFFNLATDRPDIVTGAVHSLMATFELSTPKASESRTDAVETKQATT